MSSASIESFLRAYECNTVAADIPALVAQFAEHFLAAGPQGTQMVSARDFGAALPRRYELFARCGCQGTTLISIEPTELDARYTLARTRWRMTFTRSGREPEEIVVASSFLVDVGGDGAKIALYLAHDDILEMLKCRGLMAV